MKDIEKTKKDQKGSIKPYKSITLFSSTLSLLCHHTALQPFSKRLNCYSGAGLWLIFTVCLNIL